MERVGLVAYKLQLPQNAKIHNVLHVSQLKRFNGKETKVYADPPIFWEVKAKESEAILERRVIKRGNRIVAQVLIKWKNKYAADVTREDYWVIKEKYPHFNLVGEVGSQGGGVSDPRLCFIPEIGGHNHLKKRMSTGNHQVKIGLSEYSSGT